MVLPPIYNLHVFCVSSVVHIYAPCKSKKLFQASGEFENWGDYDPNNFGGNQDCASALMLNVNVSYPAGSWVDNDCEITQFAFCQAGQLIVELYINYSTSQSSKPDKLLKLDINLIMC